jgi:phosphoribosylamine--glycine ligase
VKVLLVGGGGREHALAWKLTREHPGLVLVAAPGNPGIATLAGARCVAVRADDVDALVALADVERPDFTLVGPEAPLALGLVDRLRARGLAVFGPTQAAARIETSKAWAKQLMLDAGVPTARATRHTDAASATRAAHALGAPVVVKASGLAAGKGVIVAQTLAEAERAIDDMLVANRFGDAGAEVLVEEFMEGEEFSAFFLTDGERTVALPIAQDHKRLLRGDRGPNTGGMGAYAPVTVDGPLPGEAWYGPDGVAGAELRARHRFAHTSNDITQSIEVAVVDTTLAAMRAAGAEFTGLLYAGLMLTRDGWRVVEFNCRFGDPETQAVLPLCDRHGVALAPMFAAVARGERLAVAEPRYPSTGAAVATVVAASGYPDAPRTGDPIALPQSLPDGVTCFHAGTALDASGRLVTAGGRVLAVTAVADTFEQAQALSRATAAQVEFDGRQYRDDVGWRELARRTAPPDARAT